MLCLADLHKCQTCHSNILGSPLQFNFGDAGDERGIVIYDVDSDQFKFIENPRGKRFLKINESQLEQILSNEPNFVQKRYTHILK